jgi:hypothetical protein
MKELKIPDVDFVKIIALSKILKDMDYYCDNGIFEALEYISPLQYKRFYALIFKRIDDELEKMCRQFGVIKKTSNLRSENKTKL